MVRGFMMKQIIINADDFGIHEVVNRGIIDGHRRGCISSTTIMAGANAFDQAISLAADNPRLGVGVHLTLIGEQPVASPGTVASLVDKDGRLPLVYPHFLRLLLAGRIRMADVRRELEAQVDKVAATGIAVTHLDSHQHMHVVPGIIEIVIDIAKRFQIKAIRIPAEPIWFFGGFPSSAGRFVGRGGLSTLAGIARRRIKKAGLKTTDHFYGMLAGGSMTEPYLLNVISHLPHGTSEIMIHPGADDSVMTNAYGWQYNWQAELAAVTSAQLASQLVQERIKLISFGDLAYD
jgi:hopanoid biosynthesis associated protein HpnK